MVRWVPLVQALLVFVGSCEACSNECLVVTNDGNQVNASTFAEEYMGVEYDCDENTLSCFTPDSYYGYKTSACQGATISGCDVVECGDDYDWKKPCFNTQFEQVGTVVCDNYDWYGSCTGANMTNVDKVECRGGHSCLRASMTTVDQVTCTGYDSCNAVHVNQADVVDCEARFACIGATLFQVLNVTCDGFKSCANGRTTIEEALVVECNGQASCNFAYIVNPLQEVVCRDKKSCWGTHMSIRNNGVSILCQGGLEFGHEARATCGGAQIWVDESVSGLEVTCDGYGACGSTRKLYEKFNKHHDKLMVIEAANTTVTLICNDYGSCSELSVTALELLAPAPNTYVFA